MNCFFRLLETRRQVVVGAAAPTCGPGPRLVGTPARYSAWGRLAAFSEMCLQPWDTPAGWLLVEEAGGRVSDFSSAPYSVFQAEILASNGKIHDGLQTLLHE